MLTLTENATAIVHSIVTGQTDGGEAGLRIAAADQEGPNGEPRFAVNVVSAPESADQVIEESGSRVFLESAAAEALSDKVLDAGVDEEGAVSFTLLPRAA